MEKIKLGIGLFIVGLFVSASPAVAGTIYLSISGLPGYITTDSFKLSYSCLGCSSVQFYVSKNGGSWNSFGGAMTDASGQVQVTSSQVNEQTGYVFKAIDTSGTEAKTETIYDVSGPSNVSNYYKDGLGDGYRLHWRNPSDSDFSKVIIYRGDASDFSADASHEIATVAGGADSEMTYENHGLDPNKTYYYAIRALDKAGNSSGLVGDAGTITTTISTTPSASGSVLGASGSKVVVLPKEKGEVLPAETETPQETTQPSVGIVQKTADFVKNKTKLTVVILTGIGLLGYLLYRKLRKQ